MAVVAVGGCHCANGLSNQLFLRTYSDYNNNNFKVTQFICINKSFPVQYRILVYFVSLKFFSEICCKYTQKNTIYF